jgi:hypothetical protein
MLRNGHCDISSGNYVISIAAVESYFVRASPAVLSLWPALEIIQSYPVDFCCDPGRMHIFESLRSPRGNSLINTIKSYLFTAPYF